MVVRTPLPPWTQSGTTLDLPWYHRTVWYTPSRSRRLHQPAGLPIHQHPCF